MPRPHTLLGLLALATIAGWNALLAATRGGATPEIDGRRRPEPGEPDLVEHERGWYDYVRGFHAHHGTGEQAAPGDRPVHGDFWTGLALWYESNCLRGYTLGDHVYLCPNAPRVLRVHQAGHAPSFGAQFDPLCTNRRDDGGLDDEPLRTLDVMLPGRFPHTLLRLRDPRGLGATYRAWLRDGRIQRLPG